MKYGIYFDRPSNKYEEALPIGTGRLGAMVGGAITERKIWINEETVWYGGPRDRVNPDAINHIEEIKSLIRKKKIKEAERLAVMTLTGVPESQRHYTTLGMVVLDFFNHDGKVTNYDHRLDFETATTITRYEMDGICYEMTVHANQPESAIIIHLTADKPVLDFYAGIERGERVAQFSFGTHEDEMIRDDRNGVIMTGNCGGKNGLDFASALFGECNGETRLLGDKVVVKGASEAVLYITANTNYKEENIIERTTKMAVSARNKGFETCYSNHLTEWRPLYNRTTIGLQSVETFIVPSMNRLYDAYAKDDYSELDCICKGQTKKMLDDYMVLLLFHFGRYILLSSSRKCEMAANAQGIWCRDLLSVWDGKCTTNINLQMAYWPTDSANMSECFESYIKLAERIHKTGLNTAKRMYNCRGFVMHNNTDIWADTVVQDAGEWCSYWFVGGVWVAIDMYEHYRYTLNKQVLKRVWPIMRDAARFVMDFMDENEEGKLVMGISTSPENFYYDEYDNKVSFCEMCAMDTELITLLLDQCLEAASILTDEFGSYEAEEGFIDEIKFIRSKIDPPKISKNGQILEWGFETSGPKQKRLSEYDKRQGQDKFTTTLLEQEYECKCQGAEKGHRHQSHVIGAYPYNNITEKQPNLFCAVEKSIDARISDGGCYTGFSRVWGAGLMARLKRGDDARNMINTMAQYSSQPNLMSCCNIGNIPKLLDNNKPMQIDGSLGTVQAVIEMLLQSYNDGELMILPALPLSWETGSFSGLVARGNIVVDAQWKNCNLISAILHPRADYETTIVYKNDFVLKTPKGEINSKEGRACVNMIAGEKYYIFPL